MSDKEVRIKITGDVSDLLKKLEKIKDSFEDLGKDNGSNKAINNLIDGLSDVDRRAEQAADSLENMMSETMARNSRLDELAKELDDIDDKADKAAESLENISRESKDVNTNQYDALQKQIENLYDTGEKTKDMFSGMNDEISKLESVDLDFSSAKKGMQKLANSGDGLGSDITSGFVTGSVAGNIMSKSIGDITSAVDKLVSSLNDMKNLSLEEKVETFDQFADTIKETRKYVDDTTKSMQQAEDAAAKYAEEMTKSEDAVKAHEQRIASAEKRSASYKKQVSELNDEMDDLAKSSSEYSKELSKFQQEQSAHEKDLAKYRQEYEELNKTIADNQQKMNDNKAAYDSANQVLKDNQQQISKNIKEYEDLKRELEEFNREYFRTKAPDDDADWDDWADYTHTLGFIEHEIKAIEKMMSDLAQETDKMNNSVADQTEELKKLSAEYAELEKQSDTFEKQKKNLETYGQELDETTKKLEEVGKAFDDKKNNLDNWGQSLDKKKKELEDFRQQLEKTKKALDDEAPDVYSSSDKNKSKYEEASKQVKEYAQNLEKAKQELSGLEKIEKEHRDELSKKYTQYEKLINKIEKFLGENLYDTNVFALEELVKTIEGAKTSLDRMIIDDTVFKNTGGAIDSLLDKLDPGYIKTITEGAAEALKELDILDFNDLIKEFDSLGKAIDDKIDKTKKLRDMDRDFEDDTSKMAYSLKKQAEELKAWADTAGYAYKIVEAYDDEFEGLQLEGSIVGNKKALEESLDPKKLREYNKAFSDYMSLVKENGGQIDARYLTDSGAFDVHKFITDLERFGQPIKQLTARYKSLKQQALEYLKVQEDINKKQQDISNAKGYLEEAREAAKAAKIKADAAKEEAEAARETLKAASEAAKAKKEELIAAEKASQGTEDEINNIKKLQEEWKKLNDIRTKAVFESHTAQEKANAATKEYDEAIEEATQATKKLADAEEDSLTKKYKAIKAVNEYAEALRKLGVEIDDVKRSDIEAFDKSLASRLDNTFKDLFKDDIPGTIKEMADDIKAAFQELGNLEFGNAFDLFKDVGKGLAQNIFNKIPAGIKGLATSIGLIAVPLTTVYEYGKKEFFTGLTNAANKLRPVIDILQNLGQEMVSAFEEITDTDLDLGSLMALGPNFQYQMEQVGAIAGSNDQQLERLTKAAEHLGGTTRYTASQVGEAFQYMAMAGYDTEEMLSSIEGTLALSIASGTDLAETTDIVTDYMTALGMEANSTSEFVDKLAATVTSSNTNVKQFGMSMKQVASQAGTLGVNMTDLSTAIGLQANAGVKGQKAGTALKNMLANMNSPTDEQAKALKKLGFTLDETTGSYLMTTDGVVDLEKNVKHLMKQIEKMGSLKASALIGKVVGKEALPGVMALLGQGEEAWNELSNTIENSTGSVQYWNECMSITGKSGADATKQIENMKKVFEETELAASGINMSTEELSHAIAVLGHNGDVTAKNINDLLGVIESMNTATGETEEAWRSLDKLGNDDVNIGWDYDATISKLTADTQGLTQAEKEELQTRLKEAKTYEEAKKIAKAYGDEINKQRNTQVDLSGIVERNSFATMDYADKLEYLRNNYKEMGPEAFEAKLQQLGLGESINEVREICQMSDEDFKLYTDNLKTVKGMAEQLATAMDLTTKNALLNLASAIENVAIAAFNNLEPVIKGVTDALNEFFEIWHNGEENVFTFEGLETGLAGLATKLEGQRENIANAITGLFEGLDRFINEGALDSILSMATSIVTAICDGITEAKENGTLDAAVSGFIKKIATWIHENSDQVKQAGLDILDAIKVGINENEDVIRQACEDIAGIMTSWAKESAAIKEAASTLAEVFVEYAVDSITTKFGSKLTEWGKGLLTMFTETNPLEFIPFIGPYFRTDEDDMANFIEEQQRNKKDFSLLDLLGIGGGETKEESKQIGKNITDGVGEGMEETSLLGKIASLATGIVGSFKSELGIHSPSTVMRDEVGIFIAQGIAEGITAGAPIITQALNEALSAVKAGDSQTSLSEMLGNIDTGGAKKAFTSIRNVCYNQMINCTNIIRNQTLAWNNIIKNQTLNARNALTSQMLSMAAVTRTQMVNITNIIRNQMLNCTNIVRNQVANMRTLLGQLNSTGINIGSGISQQAQSAAYAINRSSNSLTSPQSNNQLQKQNTLPNAVAVSSKSTKSQPVNVTLKMNDIEMGRAVVDSLTALSDHSGPIALPL